MILAGGQRHRQVDHNSAGADNQKLGRMVGVALVAEECTEVGIEGQEDQSTEGCMAVGKEPRVARHALGGMTRMPYLVDRHMWPVGERKANHSTRHRVSL